MNKTILERFRKHSQGKLVPALRLLEMMEEINQYLEKLSKIKPEVQLKTELCDMVDKRLLSCRGRLGLLCGGGIDSTYLLARAGALALDVTAISAITGGNKNGLGLVDQICNEFGYKHLKTAPDEVYTKSYLENFVKKYGRFPNDPVAPLVSQLTYYAKNLGLDCCIDGQFADTVLYANPQNYILARTRYVPKLPINFGSITRFHAKPKVTQLVAFLSLDLPSRVLYLCRIQINAQSKDAVSSLLNRYDPQNVMQSIFWFVLLEYRERDKYLMTMSPIVSPFQSNELFEIAGKRKIGVGKKVLYSYIKYRYPVAHKRLHSSSFRPK